MNPIEIAAEVLAVEPGALQAQRIKGGLTNESWRVASDKEAVVVRLSTADDKLLQIDRASEKQVLRLAEAANIGAPVLLCAPERRVLVTRWLPGETPSWDAVRSRDMAQRLAQLLRRLHAVRASRTVQAVHWDAVLHGYWNSLDLIGRPSLAGSRADRKHALDIAMESAAGRHACLCHHDVYHHNVIDDGRRLWLLDWEYAGVGDPYFDLASVCCFHRYDAGLRAQLLESYSPGGGDMERLRRMCGLFDYVKDLWLAVRESAGSTTPVPESLLE